MKRTILAAAVAVSVLALGACSSTDANDEPTTTSAASSTTAAPGLSEARAEPPVIPPSTPEAAPTTGWSAEPGAVTTSVSADAGLSDAELAQWCGQAKSAMASLGTADAQIILGLLQSDASWTQSTPAQQTGVIEAVNMAARGEC
ncbi:hypothetical protein [Prescottella equi]|uniref:hypothetical protein n=1 Tax=Rhodococcus hoagii TaxID=43767 RepID=UPI000A0F5F32|nr:hypothetical protein [Prescottella equi]ORL83880.1 hypothetical protein A5N71_01145 [Prescottella equi]